MKRFLLMLLVLLLFPTLVACTLIPGDTQDNDTLADKLYAAHNPSIGNNTADSELLTLLDLSQSISTYTLELQTETEPYGLTLHFESAKPKNALMPAYACILLALIDNADEISWTFSDGTSGKMDIANADLLLDQKVKNYGASAATVQDLLNELGL